jgi:hypothetical protein
MRDGIPSVLATIPPSGRFAIPVDGADERIDCANTVVAEVVDSTPGANLLAMEELLCPDGDCREEIDGAPLRSDGVHYDDGPGGALVTEWVVAHVAEATGVERHLERD